MSDSLSSQHAWTPHQPADRVLMALKTRGPQSIAAIAQTMDVTAEAVRQQMSRLHAEGLVDAENHSTGRGRPRRSGGSRPPATALSDTHAEMTVQMIGAVRQLFGDEGIDRLIGVREAAMRATYHQAMLGASGLRDRLERLAQLRSAEGYMAELRRDGAGFLFIENHCPICSAAKACMGFCRSELELFREVLGEGARVERVEHILADAQRCAYRVSAAD